MANVFINYLIVIKQSHQNVGFMKASSLSVLSLSECLAAKRAFGM